MTNLEDQLRQRLRTTAERVVVPPDFAAHAHHRGVRRRRRRRLLLVTPVVVAATGLGVLAWLLPSPATTSLTPATTTETAATAPVELTPDLEADLTALRPSGLLTVGQNDPFTQQIPLSQWTT